MAKIWRNRLIDENNPRSFSEVPQTWKAKVIALLKEDVVNKVITAEKYEEITGEAYAK